MSDRPGEKENPLDLDCLAAERSKGAGVAGLPERISRYHKAREHALQVQSYCEAEGHDKPAQLLATCGEWLLFRNYLRLDETRLHAANFCRQHLLCPLCAIRRGAKLLDGYLPRFEAVRASDGLLRPFLVTLTVKNGDDLGERFGHLRKSMRSLTQARRDHLKAPAKNRHVEYARSLGGVHSIEFTNRGKGWHPHAHAIWMCRDQPDQVKLSEEWHAITGDSFVVDVRAVADPVDGFCEVFKYAVKFSDLTPAQQWHAAQTLKGRRLVDAHGCFRGVEIDEQLTDPALDDEPFAEYLFRHFKGWGYGLQVQR